MTEKMIRQVFDLKLPLLLAWANYWIEKYYSKIFGIRFAIRYQNRIETGQPIRFV